MTNNIKNCNISIRVTEEDNDKIERYARKRNQSKTEYITDCALAACERKSKLNKKTKSEIIEQMTKNQTIIESILNMYQTDSVDYDLIKTKILEIQEGEKKLWACSLR